MTNTDTSVGLKGLKSVTSDGKDYDQLGSGLSFCVGHEMRYDFRIL